MAATSNIDYIERITRIIQGVAIICGIFFSYTAYVKQKGAEAEEQRKSAIQAANQYRKFFYEKQFELYEQATQATATLASERMNSDDYNLARKKFRQLFLGKLCLVESKDVEIRMISFNKTLVFYEANPTLQEAHDSIEHESIRLGNVARLYTLMNWFNDSERQAFNLIE